MTVNVILAHTEANHSNFLSSVLFDTGMGWLLVFIGIAIVVSIVVVAITTQESDENRAILQEQAVAQVMRNEQFNQEG